MTHTSGTKEWACKNVNFSKGCSNACNYCYARRMGNRFGWKSWEDWANMVNRETMGKKRFKKIDGVIMTPSSHDLTEENLTLARKVLFNLLDSGNQVLIVSKPNLNVIRHLRQHLCRFKGENRVNWRFTISTLDDDLRKYWEPGAPSIKDRLNALKETFDEGWKTSVSIEPFLDHDVVKLVKVVSPYVTGMIWIGPMNKVHVPRKFWNDSLTELYSPSNLYWLKNEIDSLDNPKIRYKDHFLTGIAKYNKNRQISMNRNTMMIQETPDMKICDPVMSRQI